MHKTKLGISVGILGSIICILGAVAGLQWYFIGIVAYILRITSYNVCYTKLLRDTCAAVFSAVFTSTSFKPFSICGSFSRIWSENGPS